MVILCYIKFYYMSLRLKAFSYVGQSHMNFYGSKQQGIWSLFCTFHSKLIVAIKFRVFLKQRLSIG